jgi:hypothetical protein
MTDFARRSILTALLLVFYVGAFHVWGGGPHAASVAALLWPLVVWIVTARIWLLRWPQAVAVGLAAIAAVAIWSTTLVDFPSPAVERLPWVFEWLLVLAPILLTPLAGLAAPKGGPLLAALAILLANAAMLPVWIANSNANVAGGWAMYPYPGVIGEIVLWRSRGHTWGRV